MKEGNAFLVSFNKMIFFQAGLGVFLYPKDEERIQYTGVKTEEGLSKFLVKKFGEVITVRIANLLQKPLQFCFKFIENIK